MSYAEIEDVLATLPHRYPFLLLDRVVEFEAGKSLTALKNVTFNEPFFQGHFPDHPIMPGVMILEALAQACGMLAKLSRPEEFKDGQLFYLAKVDKARFRRLVVPGDQLFLEVIEKRVLKRMGFYSVTARVNEEVAASAELLCAERSPDK